VVGVLGIYSFLVHGAPDVKAGRSIGGSGDPNFFAAYQVLAVPLVLVMAGEARNPRVRIALWLAVLIAVGSVLTTLSRGGLIALVTVVVLTLALPSRSLFRSPGQKASATLAVLLVGAIGFASVSSTFLPRLRSPLGQGGGSGRLVLWAGALTAVKERPLTGIGYGSFQAVSDALVLRTPGVSLQAYDLPPQGQVVHNAYLGAAAEIGLPGLALFLGLLVSTARSLRRTATRASALGAAFVSRVANSLVVGLVGWGLASIFLSSATARPFWMVIGLSLALPKLLAPAVQESYLPAARAAWSAPA
jgi:O-antigen ligase